MKLKGTILPGYVVYEYFLIISLPRSLQEDIIRLRQDFHTKFETHHKIKGRPSLALALFLQYGTMQERVVDLFQRVAAFFAPVEVKLKDFGSFPKHSIHVAVEENSPLSMLGKNIRSQAKGLMQVNKETKPMITIEPHIGIARKLKPDVFEQSWRGYKEATFNYCFIAGEMILLRRLTHDDGWQLVKAFEFRDKALPSTQGKLF
ncbi:MAG: hypothetical protein EOO04_25400 [Chitinophagaceae bacterium]|nr:MAG: hypothetical protein EOO04_25400 [Chitinophagaceae bacterium]